MKENLKVFDVNRVVCSEVLLLNINVCSTNPDRKGFSI